MPPLRRNTQQPAKPIGDCLPKLNKFKRCRVATGKDGTQRVCRNHAYFQLSPLFPQAFLNNAVEDWLKFVAKPLLRKGQTRREARAFATIVIAGFRGFMLDYCASHDRERVDRAVDLWLHSLDAISSQLEEVSHVR